MSLQKKYILALETPLIGEQSVAQRDKRESIYLLQKSLAADPSQSPLFDLKIQMILGIIIANITT